jgi:hypothetical protein
MSYVFVVRNPLGQVEVELTSDAASTPEGGTCTGYIKADNGSCCCPSRTWRNAIYLLLKGAASSARLNETRVLAALDGALSQSALASVAQGAHASVEPHFLAAVSRARQNFVDVWQPERWSYTGRNETKGYSVGAWVDNGPADPARWEAGVNRIAGRVIAHVDAAAVQDLGSRAAGVFGSVTGSGPLDHVSDMPTPESVRTQSGNMIVPTAWTESLLDLLTPGWRTASTRLTQSVRSTARVAMPRNAPVLSHPVIPATTHTMDQPVSPPPGAPAPAPEPSGMGTGTIIAIGVGVLAVGGGAAWYLTRKPAVPKPAAATPNRRRARARR